MRRLLLFALLLLIPLAGCDSPDEDAIDVVLVGDPADEDDAASRLVLAATAPSLIALDAEARLSPALAESWIVTDDGLSYIFRLRADTLRAPEVRTALQARIRALRDDPLGDDLRIIDSIVARTGRVIEIRLRDQMPDFLQLLVQPELALPALGDAGGPMALSEDGDALVVETERGRRSLRFAIESPPKAVASFQSGRAEILLGGGLEALPYVETGGLLRGSIRLDPVAGLFGLSIKGDEGLVADVSVREAIAMSIDRDTLMTPFGIGGWVPARGVIPPGVSLLAPDDRPDWLVLDIESRRAIAQARIDAWRRNSDEAPILLIALPEGKGGDLLFESLRRDIAKIGIGLNRVRADEEADLELVDIVATHGGVEWYLNRLTCRARDGACDPQADAALAAARAAPPGGEKQALLAAAEAQYRDSHRYIAFGPPVRFSLVRGGVAGFTVNARGFHPLPPLALSPE